MNIRKPLLCLLFSMAGFALKAQQNDQVPLFTYLQNNFDTTFILESYSAWSLSRPNYQVACVKNNHWFFFTYKNAVPDIVWRKSMTKELDQMMRRKHAAFNTVKPDTNFYFLPVYASAEMNRSFRTSIDSIPLWLIKTDDRSRCNVEVYDAGVYHIHSFTKTTHKKTSFYAPQIFDAECPGDQNRRWATRFIALMNSVIPLR